MKHSFELIDGRIYLVLTTMIWGGDVVEKRDITDGILPVLDDYINEQLDLGYDYKHVNNVITYVGKDKDKYKK